ncbi:hypothetical protein BKA65DRAFT_541969 [Rhexocercosporidium sp. MPI-PUGE-AT-0058]|nr:hypothetical protein BKA65DRAFT_541969 [Rhexocercosporidium sp. MPI-PUGE-AT-0058]
MMAAANYLHVLAFATFTAFALAVDSDSSLNPFSESAFQNGNASLDVSSGSFSFAQLIPRQQQCAIPGDYLCPSGLGCCGPTENCMANGCCGKQYETCSGTGCYATGATCCSGYVCAGTDNCFLGKCCPKTSETCRGTGCWTLGAVCCSGGSRVCDSGEECCPNGCMPADAGNTCCGQIYCKTGAFCCSGQTRCCPDEWICCGDTCCSPGTKCSEGTCVSPSTSKTQPSTSSSSRQAPTQSSPKLSTPKLPTSSSTPTSTKSCVTSVPSPTGAAIKSLPVIEFIYIDTEYEPFGDIVKSMCLGMKRRNVVGNQDILTYAGSRDPCYKDRRSEVKCGGCCTNLLKDSGPFKGFPTSCDEYPFASTVEGGTGAHKSCVVGFQNSLQGGKLGPFMSKLAYGQQFIVRIVGIQCADVQESDLQGCVNGGSKLKRQDSVSQSASGFTDLVRAVDNSSNTKAAIMPLLDGSGQYNVNLLLQSGSVDSVSVYSNAGARLDDGLISLGSLSSTGSSFNFDLDYEEYGVGVFAYTNQNSINVSYSVTMTPNTASATESGATSTSTKKSNAATLGSSAWLLFCLLLFFGCIIFSSN